MKAKSIAPKRLYNLSDILEIVDWGSQALRKARNEGLRVLYYGRHGYVIGADLIAFIEANAKTSRGPTKSTEQLERQAMKTQTITCKGMHRVDGKGDPVACSVRFERIARTDRPWRGIATVEGFEARTFYLFKGTRPGITVADQLVRQTIEGVDVEGEAVAHGDTRYKSSSDIRGTKEGQRPLCVIMDDEKPTIEVGQVWRRDGVDRLVLVVETADLAEHRPADKRKLVRWTRPGWKPKNGGTRVWLDEFERWAEEAELIETKAKTCQGCSGTGRTQKPNPNYPSGDTTPTTSVNCRDCQGKGKTNATS